MDRVQARPAHVPPAHPLELEVLVLRVRVGADPSAVLEWDLWFDRLPAPGRPGAWVGERREPEGDRAGARARLEGASLEEAIARAMLGAGSREVELEVEWPGADFGAPA